MPPLAPCSASACGYGHPHGQPRPRSAGSQMLQSADRNREMWPKLRGWVRQFRFKRLEIRALAPTSGPKIPGMLIIVDAAIYKLKHQVVRFCAHASRSTRLDAQFRRRGDRPVAEAFSFYTSLFFGLGAMLSQFTRCSLLAHAPRMPGAWRRFCANCCANHSPPPLGTASDQVLLRSYKKSS